MAYDPWLDLATNWPEVDVRLVPMSGWLLGELRYPVIRLRAGTSAAQRRCTLAHELVHLERGISASGALGRREELFVHREAARRLLPFPILAAAVRALGEEADARSLARELDVDGETLELRLAMLSEAQRRELDRVAASRLVAA